MSLHRAEVLHGSLQSLVSLKWSNTLGNAKSFLNKKDRLALSGLIDRLFLPPSSLPQENITHKGDSASSVIIWASEQFSADFFNSTIHNVYTIKIIIMFAHLLV